MGLTDEGRIVTEASTRKDAETTSQHSPSGINIQLAQGIVFSHSHGFVPTQQRQSLEHSIKNERTKLLILQFTYSKGIHSKL